MYNNILETKVLWSSDTPFKNQYSIMLEDSIDNYDEIVFYGSANRGGNDRVNVKTEFPIVSGCVNLGGPYTLNTWQSTNYYMLNNGTQVYLSGNSGFIDVSYYWGMQNGGTNFEANRYTTARNADVHPYKIVGVKTKLKDKIWETTGNTYETNIQLNEPITHFNKLLIYSSGTENSEYGVHLAKNVYTVQPFAVNGCDAWGYSPWALNFRCNYILGCSLKLSGNSGHIGSAYYWGIGQNNATWAAGKWTGTAAPRMLQPYHIFGIDRKPTHKLKLLNTPGGTLSADITNGYEYDTTTLTNTTANENYKFSSYKITGATLTGNEFMWNDNDVQVQGNFEHNKTLTLIDGEHAVLSADKDKGFIGDVVTVTGTMDEGWYLTGFNTTGATMTGNQFAFVGEDVTVEGLYTDEGFPVTYQVQGGGTLTGEDMAIPGQPLSIQSAYNTYWRLSGFDLTGGYIQDNQIYPSSAPFVVKAVYKPNAFTASGGWEKGSDFTVSHRGAGTTTTAFRKYAITSYHTSNVPTAWYSTSNRWNPSNASSYSMTINSKCNVTGAGDGSRDKHGGSVNYTATTLVGTTQNQNQTFSQGWGGYSYTASFNYSKSFTTTTQNNYSISGVIKANGSQKNASTTYGYTAKYIAARTSGTWTATGYAP